MWRGMRAAVLAAAVLCWLAGPVLGDIVETGEFKIMQPVARKMKAEIAFGNFGRPEYGGDLQGHLVVPYEDALSKSGDCSSRGCRYGCESLVAQNYTAQKIMGLPAIMMLERGPPDHFCDFFNLYASLLLNATLDPHTALTRDVRVLVWWWGQSWADDWLLWPDCSVEKW